MLLKRLSLVALILAGLFVQTALSQGLITVGISDDDAMFTSVQKAVDAAKPGDIIEILDYATYNEQVTIDSTKHGITIRSKNPKSITKPVIKWQDVTNRHPLTSNDAKDPDRSGQFETCGALRIIRARGVTLDGIAIDGGGPAPFGNASVWCPPQGGNCSNLFHGNAAVAVVVAGATVIRNCDFYNAYFGIAVKDRNTGGIFANPNPADRDITVPLSGFGKTGNHLFEHNRVHNNVMAFFFESSWDLGSTVRFNLIYSNKFTPTITRTYLSSFSDGANNHPGAFMFKDSYVSPLAIYNNTMWDNYANFIGHWKTGGQHLIFNNIFSNSSELNSSTGTGNTYMIIDHMFPQRTKYNLFSAAERFQVQCQGNYAQTPYNQGGCFMADVAITNDLGNAARENVTVQTTQAGQTQSQQMALPGALIPGAGTNAFAAGANNRWLQTAGGTYGSQGSTLTLPNLFESLDPASPSFLVPKWSDPLVQNYVSQKGWPDIAIRNPFTGNIADIGAVQQNPNNKTTTTVGRIMPTNVVLVNGTSAQAFIYFSVEDAAVFKDPKIKFIKWIAPIPDNSDDATWANTFKIVPASSIHNVTPPATVLEVGSNRFAFTIPSIPAGTDYGFFELTVEGTDASGNLVTSDVGFLPYRTLSHFLDIKVLHATTNTVLTEVTAGERVRLQVTPLENTAPFTQMLKEIEFSLFNGATELMWYYDNPDQPLVNVKNLTGTGTYNIYFKKAGPEVISGAGIYEGANQYLSFLGMTEILVKPAEPSQVTFYEPIPRSQLELTGNLDRAPAINPGRIDTVRVLVQDRFGNAVNSPISMRLDYEGQDPSASCSNVGEILTSTATTNPANGMAAFAVRVGCGMQGQWFDMKASVASIPGASDIGRLRVGKTQDRLYIFFSDNVAGAAGRSNIPEYYNDTVSIHGTAGDGNREPVYIKAVSGGAVMDGADFKVCVSATDYQIEFYDGNGAGANKLGSERVTINLVNGEGMVWITANADVSNAFIEAGAVTGSCDEPDVLINNAFPRGNVNFTRPVSAIKNGIVYAGGNGNGVPDTMIVQFDAGEFSFGNGWSTVPDSVTLIWPADTAVIAGFNWQGVSTMVKVGREQVGGVWNIDTIPRSQGSEGLQVRVIFPNNSVHPIGYTSVIGSRDMLGALRWNSGSGSDWTWMEFPIIEKIGPIISAKDDISDAGQKKDGPMIWENIGAERLRDTLMIQISEELKDPVSMLTGASIMHKNAGGTVRTVEIASATVVDGNWKLVLGGAIGDYDIMEGDSIRFSPAKGITDKFDNAVQDNNRWVRVGLKPLPPEIVSDESFYRNDPPGVGLPVNLINYLEVKFTKGVNVSWFDSLTVTFQGIDAKCKVSERLGAIDGNDADGGIVRINLNQAFPDGFGDAVRNLTGGPMALTVVYDKNSAVAGSWNRTSGVIRDEAAPVLVSEGDPRNDNYVGAVLKTGVLRSDGGFDRDTLIITYTEKLHDDFRLNRQPLKFWRGSDVVAFPYLDIITDQPVNNTAGWHRVFYLVSETGFGFPDNSFLRASDSVSIDENSDPVISDEAGNEQASLNKKIPIRIENEPRWGLMVKNNPFSARVSGRDFTTIVFTPNLKGADDLNATVKVMLYDNMGNLVRTDELKGSGELSWTWKGHNKRGRMVGSGTYHLKAVMHMESKSRGLSDRTTEIRAIGFVR